MNVISMARLAKLVQTKRKEKNLTQQAVQDATGINRLLLGRMEKGNFMPSLPQLNALAELLDFHIEELLESRSPDSAALALRGEAKSGEEREGMEHLYAMMGFLKSQMLLRSRNGLPNEKNT